MPRSYTAQDFIQLPPFDANETVTVVRQIAGAASRAQHVPASVTDALTATVHAVDALDAELARDKRPAGDPQVQRAADHGVDVAWNALESFLRAWLSLPAGASPHTAHASRVHDRLFPDGMKFLNLAFRAEWAESERRLTTLHDEKLDAAIVEMGGKAFVDNVRRAHKAYSDALGMTAAVPTEPDASAVLARRNETLGALRTLVAEIASASERKHGGLAHATATALLRPITAWTPTHHAATAGAATGSDGGATGATGATGAAATKAT